MIKNYFSLDRTLIPDFFYFQKLNCHLHFNLYIYKKSIILIVVMILKRIVNIFEFS